MTRRNFQNDCGTSRMSLSPFGGFNDERLPTVGLHCPEAHPDTVT